MLYFAPTAFEEGMLMQAREWRGGGEQRTLERTPISIGKFCSSARRKGKEMVPCAEDPFGYLLSEPVLVQNYPQH